MEPTFFEDNVVWKLQVRNSLPVFGSVFLFGTVWHTTILRHFQKLALFASGGHFYLLGPTSLVFRLITPSPLFVLHRVYTLPWSRWNRTHKYVRCTVRDSRIRSEYEPFNNCITVHSVWMMRIFNVMILNTCSRKKDEKIVNNQDGGLKVPLFDL